MFQRLPKFGIVRSERHGLSVAVHGTGTMPPFGNLYNVPTLVDKSLTDGDYIVFEAGTHTDAVKMSYADFARLAKPEEAEFAVKSR